MALTSSVAAAASIAMEECSKQFATEVSSHGGLVDFDEEVSSQGGLDQDGRNDVDEMGHYKGNKHFAFSQLIKKHAGQKIKRLNFQVWNCPVTSFRSRHDERQNNRLGTHIFKVTTVPIVVFALSAVSNMFTQCDMSNCPSCVPYQT